MIHTNLNLEDSNENIAQQIFTNNLREYVGMLKLDAIVVKSMLDCHEMIVIKNAKRA